MNSSFPASVSLWLSKPHRILEPCEPLTHLFPQRNSVHTSCNPLTRKSHNIIQVSNTGDPSHLPEKPPWRLSSTSTSPRIKPQSLSLDDSETIYPPTSKETSSGSTITPAPSATARKQATTYPLIEVHPTTPNPSNSLTTSDTD